MHTQISVLNFFVSPSRLCPCHSSISYACMLLLNSSFLYQHSPFCLQVSICCLALFQLVQDSRTLVLLSPLLCSHTLLTAQRSLTGHCWDSYMTCTHQRGSSCSSCSSTYPKHSTDHDYCFFRPRLMFQLCSCTVRNLGDCLVMHHPSQQESGGFVRVLYSFEIIKSKVEWFSETCILVFVLFSYKMKDFSCSHLLDEVLGVLQSALCCYMRGKKTNTKGFC